MAEPGVAHHHADVSGGWLRAGVFGAMDGLVTNIALVAGVGGGGAGRHTIILTGMAGLVAGAFSMALGEFASVDTQNDAVAHEVSGRLERQQVRRCLHDLTELQRQAVTLAYYQGHTYLQVAELLGAPLPTVKTRMRDGLIRLRDCLGSEVTA